MFNSLFVVSFVVVLLNLDTDLNILPSIYRG